MLEVDRKVMLGRENIMSLLGDERLMPNVAVHS